MAITLKKPAIGSTGWGSDVNNNFTWIEDALNSYIGAVIWFADDSLPSGWLECDGSEISMTTYEDLYDVIKNVFGLDIGTSCTADNTTDTFTATAHGLSDDDVVEFTAATMPTGLSTDTKYFVISSAANTFQVSTTKGVPAVNFCSDGMSVKFHIKINVPDLRGEFVRGWDHGRGVDSGRSFASSQTDAFQGHWHDVLGYGDDSVRGSGAVSLYPIYNANSGNHARSPVTDGTNGTPRIASETRPTNLALLACIKY